MCRTAGRRCPACSDPMLIAERNARRRAAYKTKNNKTDGAPIEIAARESAVKPTFVFPEFNSSHDGIPLTSDEGKKFMAEADAFTKAVDPNFNDAEWDAFQEKLEDESYDPYYRQELNEAMSIQYYSEYGYGEVRSYLTRDDLGYNGEVKQSYFSDENIKTINHTISQLDSALAKAEAPENSRLLYRGMMLPSSLTKPEEAEKWLAERFPVGGVISQKNYMSTSIDPATASNFNRNQNDEHRSVVFEIASKQGAPLGKGVSIYSYMEKEVLMPRDARFKVESVTTGVMYKTVHPTKGTTITPRTVIRLIDAEEIS